MENANRSASPLVVLLIVTLLCAASCSETKAPSPDTSPTLGHSQGPEVTKPSPPKAQSQPAAPSCRAPFVLADERSGQPDLFLVTADLKTRRQLTNDTANELWPKVSPDGRFVAYESDAGGTRHIHVLELATGVTKRLTEGKGQEWSPTWTPDGRAIVYMADRAGSGMLYISDVSSGHVRAIPGTIDGAQPSVAPDGLRLVYRQELPRNDEIATIRLDGSDHRNISNAAGNDVAPAWSPDGRFIAYESARDQNSEIYLFALADDSTTRLTDDALEDQFPTFAPDGSAIVYTHHGALSVMNLDGTAQRPVGQAPISGIMASFGPCESGT